VRIGRANDLREQCECGVVQPVFLQDGIEGNLFAMVPKFDIWTSKTIPSRMPGQSVSCGRNTNSAPGSMNLLISQGQATRPTDLHPFAGNPSHRANSLSTLTGRALRPSANRRPD
jgi:hypothetical protein